jgi:hypothetical protein
MAQATISHSLTVHRLHTACGYPPHLNCTLHVVQHHILSVIKNVMYRSYGHQLFLFDALRIFYKRLRPLLHFLSIYIPYPLILVLFPDFH